jgi:hypothetical protein
MSNMVQSFGKSPLFCILLSPIGRTRMSNEIFRKVRIAKIRDSSFEHVVDKKSRALNYDKEK